MVIPFLRSIKEILPASTQVFSVGLKIGRETIPSKTASNSFLILAP